MVVNFHKLYSLFINFRFKNEITSIRKFKYISKSIQIFAPKFYTRFKTLLELQKFFGLNIGCNN